MVFVAILQAIGAGMLRLPLLDLPKLNQRLPDQRAQVLAHLRTVREQMVLFLILARPLFFADSADLAEAVKARETQ